VSTSAPAESFWQRRVVGPIVALFRQGLTPDRIAWSLAIGAACSLFPFLGFTSLLNLGVGLRLGLNQPLLQMLNQLLTPVHLVMIVVYVRLGEWLWRAHDDPFTVQELLRTFREASVGEFLHRFGWAGVHAFTAWLLTAPLLIWIIYRGTRPVLRRLASKKPAQP
jgi:uncharacterized protein (DUF2062 family)